MDALKVLSNGFAAAVQVHRTLLFVVTARTTAIRTLQCFTLNGVIFLGSIAFFNFVLTPLLDNIGDAIRVLSNTTLEDNPLGDDDIWVEILNTVQNFTSGCFTILWLVPMYAISFILNTIWYVDIAEQVFKQEYGKSNPTTTITALFRDELYRMLLMIWLTLQIYSIYYFVPYFGTIYLIVYTSWIYSFYCYDYKWTLQGWELEQRLRVFEEHWLYMLGFGLPCAILTWWLPQFVGYGIYAMLFPLNMILAIISTPEKLKPNTTLPIRVRMFRFAQWCNLLLFKRIGPAPKETLNENKKQE